MPQLEESVDALLRAIKHERDLYAAMQDAANRPGFRFQHMRDAINMARSAVDAAVQRVNRARE